MEQTSPAEKDGPVKPEKQRKDENEAGIESYVWSNTTIRVYSPFCYSEFENSRRK